MRRRCSKCDINYPNETSYMECPVCDVSTVQLSGEVDEDHALRAELLIWKSLSVEERKSILWRRKRLVGMGYLGAMLDLLTDSPIDLHDIERLIKRGCSPDLAARIVL